MADLTGGNLATSIRAFLALRNPHVRAVLAAYRPRPVPRSPEELAAARKRRRAQAVVAGVVTHLAGERLPLYTAGAFGPEAAVGYPSQEVIPDLDTHGPTGSDAACAAQGSPDTRAGQNETILSEAGRQTDSPSPDAPGVYNRRPYSCYLCPDPTCPANRPGHQLYLRQRDWRGKEPPRCEGHGCEREMVLVAAGEMYMPTEEASQ